MHIVVYRPHNALQCETQYIGPFPTFGDAYEHLASMPALGQYRPDGTVNSPGVKYVEMLAIPTLAKPA